jgi:hypothetical protein
VSLLPQARQRHAFFRLQLFVSRRHLHTLPGWQGVALQS